MDDFIAIKAEIIEVLRANQSGLTFDQLYAKCYRVFDRTGMSRAVHRCVTQGVIFKREGQYILTEFESPVERNKRSVTEEIKELIKEIPEIAKELSTDSDNGTDVKEKIQPRIIPVLKKKNPVKKETPVEKPFGKLRRTKTTGAIAYCLYRFRDSDPLTIDEIKKLTVIHQSAYSFIKALLKDNYIKIINPNERNKKYVWADNYRYPFANYEETDKGFICFTPIEWEKEKNKDHQTVAVKIDPETVIAVRRIENLFSSSAMQSSSSSEQDFKEVKVEKNTLLLYIEEKINQAENELNKLKAIKNVLEKQGI